MRLPSVPIGKVTYMIAEQQVTGFTGRGNMKAEIIAECSKYCANQEKEFQIKITKKPLLIVDDHPLFREGLRSIIARDSRDEIVGEAGNGHEALRMIGQRRPDLVMPHIALPDRTGIELPADIKRISPKTTVIIISVHSKVTAS
jgi:PleD family two-component response regulator